MTTTTTGPMAHAATSRGRRMLNKVPEVTLFFWVIKIMCTTVGETAADYLNENLGFGLTKTTYVTGALLVVLLVVQFRLRRYVPAGLLGGRRRHQRVRHAHHRQHDRPLQRAADDEHDRLRDRAGRRVRRLVRQSSARCRSTRSSPPAARPSTGWRSSSPSRWAPPPATSSAEKLNLGYAVSILIFGGLIALVTVAHYAFKLNAVLAFWLAYILTRPLGASIGDEMSQNSHKYGGLGLGTTGTSYIFLGCILALVSSCRSRAATRPRPASRPASRLPEAT